MTGPDFDAILRKAPKALLHDHLDGGLRPTSVVELAAEYGYTSLPTTDVDDLAIWFNRGAKRNDLVMYLETFAHTVGVMQHRDAIEVGTRPLGKSRPPKESSARPELRYRA